MSRSELRVQLLHPEALPADGDGLPFTQLAGRVAALLPPSTLAQLGSLGWYTTAVKLDLEARGLIQRVPNTQPQRLRPQQ